MHGLTRSILIAALALGAACGLVPGDAAVREAISARNQEFMTAVKAMDASAVAGLYTEDGQLLPPAAEPQSGRIAIKEYFLAMFGQGVSGVTLETLDLVPADSIAVETGTYAVAGPGGATLDRGKYVVVWKHEDGAWRLYRDIWNTSMPAAPADTTR